MSIRDAVGDLLRSMAEINPERPQLALLRDFLAPNGVVDTDRFAAMMTFATRVVAYVPGADTHLIEGVKSLRERGALRN